MVKVVINTYLIRKCIGVSSVVKYKKEP
jgi:hypothetical protein